ncbi:MAG: hypothetical protein HYV28_05285, partial [Ignavibacteriales bacterium]|nr:hypothetical protein [Ignavibacteriales bacterium]
MKRSIVLFVVSFFLIAGLLRAQTAPVLATPVNNATDVFRNQIFTWNPVAGAVYRVQISTSPSFGWNQIDVSGLSTTSYQAAGLYYYTPYYWRVGATIGGVTTFSGSWQFTTGQSLYTNNYPVLVTPANNATNIQATNTFYWQPVSGASSYRLQISTTSNFSVTQFDIQNISSTNYQVVGLYYGTGYYWRVAAVTSGGTNYSPSWQFTTGSPGGSNGNPGPVLVTPASGATNVAPNSTFTWDAVSGATYRIQISTSSYFGYNQIDAGGLTSPSYTASGLYLVTPYFWRVNATTASGTTDWSATSGFTTSATNTPSAPSA